MAQAAWLLALACNFAPHLLIAALALLLIALWRRQRLAIVCSTVAACLTATIVVHGLTVSDPRATRPDDAAKVRLMTFNILYNNRDMPAVARLIRRESPDIVVFQEFEPRQKRALAPLAAGYPHRFGGHTMIWSRLPARRIEPRLIELPRWRHVLAEITTPDGEALRVLATHMPRPIPLRRSRLQEDALGWSAVLSRAYSVDIAAGDFNATRYMPRFRQFLRAAGLRAEPLGLATGTVPVWVPPPLGLHIDHVLTGRCWRIANRRTGSPAGSNHRPLIAELVRAPGCS